MSQPVWTTTDGRLRGARENGCLTFRGVPYALPPVGERRFRSPAAVVPWSGVRDATRSRPASLQMNKSNKERVEAFVARMDPGVPGVASWPSYTAETYDQEDISEDCLYLDVWMPQGADERPLPVYVYYHGGANAVSSGHFDLEDGANLAIAERVIVVRPTYRLGALGWLHVGLLDDRFAEAVNLGVQDQMAALRWVHANIEALGGDPANIAIGGESCGATAVSHLLCMPEAQRIVRRAVIQSLSPFNIWCTQQREEAEAVVGLYAELLGIRDLGELLEIDAERLLAVHSILVRLWPADANLAWRPIGPVVSGEVGQDTPAMTLSDAAYPRRDLELIIGMAEDEWEFFRGHTETMRHGTKAQVLAVLAQVFEAAEPLYGDYARMYPSFPPGRLLSAIMSMEFFKYSSLAIADNMSRRGHRVHVFQFSYQLPGHGGYLHAAHTGDTPIITRNLEEERLRRWPAFDGADRSELRSMAETYGGMFGRFLRGDDPGSDWPRYDREGGTILALDLGMAAVPRLLGGQTNAFRNAGVTSVRELERRLVSNVRRRLASGLSAMAT